MIFSAPPRNLRPELLDLDEAPFEEVKDSLQDVQRVNRYLSGYRVLLHHMGRFFDRHNSPQPLNILDAATGSADQPMEVVRYARQRGIPVRVTAIDINHKMLRFAQEEAQKFPEIRFVQCDALNMPFGENSFDVVINSLALHHFSRDHAVALLKSFSRLARRDCKRSAPKPGGLRFDLHFDAIVDAKSSDPIRRAGFGDECLHAGRNACHGPGSGLATV